MKLEDQCRQRVRHLQRVARVQGAWTMADLCRALKMLRAPRHLMLYPFPMPRGQTGLWVQMRTIDVIFYAQNAPPVLRDHALLHEIAHMVCEHGTNRVADEQILNHLAGLLIQEDRSTAMLYHRSRYDSAQEQEAELQATLLGISLTSNIGSVSLVTRVETPEERQLRERLDTWITQLRTINPSKG